MQPNLQYYLKVTFSSIFTETDAKWQYTLFCRVRKEGDTTEEKLKSACGNVLLALEDQTPELAEQAVSDPETKPDKDKYQFDVFISYSHKTPDKAEKLLATFKSIVPTIKVFYDRSALTTGKDVS